MNWILVIAGGVFEVAFTFCLGKMKGASGSAKIWWFTFFAISLLTSMTLLWKATQSLPIGTAYAVWTGVGAVGTVLMGILVFNEPSTFWRLFFISTLVGSIIGLKFVSN
jgi:quaternary ammonium compound-resistance protein SugE